MLYSKYGTDKPDLRNPLIINDITEIFKVMSFDILKTHQISSRVSIQLQK